MRTLAESLASIGESAGLIAGIKSNIKAAIEAHGVEVPEGHPFSGYPDLIAEIDSSGGLGGFNLPERFLIATGKRKLVIKAGTILPLAMADETKYFIAAEDTELNFDSILDTGTPQAGLDYYVFLVPDPDNPSGVTIKASLSKTAPQGFGPGEVLRFGGGHSLCIAVGSGLTYVEGGVTKNHPLNGYVAGDMLPQSVWCLNHRPHSDPEGMVYIPSLDFWCDIYLQSGSGANTRSVYQGAITRSRQYVDFVEDQFCVKKELLDDGEFAAAMLGSNEQTNVQGTNEAGATTGGAGGRLDTAGRRMISIYGVEEGCGSLFQWLRSTSAGGYSGYMGPMGSVTTSSYGPYDQAGGKGKFWGLAGALLAGGVWSNAASCGSRARDADNGRSDASTILGGRGRSRAIRI
jgi:hypothetical protein